MLFLSLSVLFHLSQSQSISTTLPVCNNKQKCYLNYDGSPEQYGCITVLTHNPLTYCMINGSGVDPQIGYVGNCTDMYQICTDCYNNVCVNPYYETDYPQSTIGPQIQYVGGFTNHLAVVDYTYNSNTVSKNINIPICQNYNGDITTALTYACYTPHQLSLPTNTISDNFLNAPFCIPSMSDFALPSASDTLYTGTCLEGLFCIQLPYGLESNADNYVQCIVSYYTTTTTTVTTTAAAITYPYTVGYLQLTAQTSAGSFGTANECFINANTYAQCALYTYVLYTVIDGICTCYNTTAASAFTEDTRYYTSVLATVTQFCGLYTAGIYSPAMAESLDACVLTCGNAVAVTFDGANSCQCMLSYIYTSQLINNCTNDYVTQVITPSYTIGFLTPQTSVTHVGTYDTYNQCFINMYSSETCMGSSYILYQLDNNMCSCYNTNNAATLSSDSNYYTTLTTSGAQYGFCGYYLSYDIGAGPSTQPSYDSCVTFCNNQAPVVTWYINNTCICINPSSPLDFAIAGCNIALTGPI